MNLKNIITRLLKDDKTRILEEKEIQELCQASSKLLMSQKMLLKLKAPFNLCGDTHGQFSDLLKLFQTGGFPPKIKYLFLGDYVDRGKKSVEVMSLLLAFKLKFPSKMFLLRGNHECERMNLSYGFFDECKRRYSVKLWKAFTDVFNRMPVAATIDKKIFCVHGGISPKLSSLRKIKEIVRPTVIIKKSLLEDLMWSDPDKTTKEWRKSHRGAGVEFGAIQVAEFLYRFDLELIVRAHQHKPKGYEFFADKQLVTIFSAPNYSGKNNDGVIMCVSKNLECSFKKIKV